MQKVSVPQKDGEILISRAGEPAVTYPVKNGIVEVEDEYVDGFLRQLPGAQISAGNPSPKEA